VQAHLANALAKLARSSVGLIREDKTWRDPVVDGTLEQAQRELWLRRELNVVRNSRFSSARSVFRPGLGQVQRKVDRHLLRAGRNRQADADLAVRRLAR
jgi:hypothetical protein